MDGQRRPVDGLIVANVRRFMILLPVYSENVTLRSFLFLARFVRLYALVWLIRVLLVITCRKLKWLKSSCVLTSQYYFILLSPLNTSTAKLIDPDAVADLWKCASGMSIWRS